MILNRTKKQWIILIALASANIFNAMCTTLQGPFFPAEAEKKGATASEYGLVFGIYSLIGFILSPIYGHYMKKIGVKRLYLVGIFTAGVSTIIFGALDQIPGHYAFIGAAFACRIIEAAGNYAFLTSTFAFVALEFPENIATVFGALGSCFGVGFIIGPMVSSNKTAKDFRINFKTFRSGKHCME
jgi:MFS family permease